MFYRASRTYQLSESAYFEMLRRVGVANDEPTYSSAAAKSLEFFRWMTGDATPAVADPYAFQELKNHWIPLTRLLRSHERFLLGTVSPREYAGSEVSRLSATHLKEQHQVGTAAFGKGQWALAVESWSHFENAPLGAERNEALLGRLVALEKLEDFSLATNEARTLALFDPDPELRSIVVQRKLAQAAHKGDLRTAEQWAAIQALENPTPRRLSDLAAALIRNQRFDYATLVLQCIPEALRPHDAMLMATYQAEWWRAFDKVVQQLPFGQREFWTAQKQLRWGNYDAAKSQWSQAGPDGQRWLQHLYQGEKILTSLTCGNQSERMAAVHAWEAWQSSHPGPRIWREEGSLVASCPGTVSVRSIDRELYGQYYLADPGAPLVLAVQGPVRLKLEMRPVHGKSSPASVGDELPLEDIPLDDRILIQTIGHERSTRVVGVFGNRASLGLDIVGDARKPGSDVPAFIDVPPGSHRIEIRGANLPIAVRAFASRPAFPLPVLPAITRETLAAVIHGSFGHAVETPYEWNGPRSLASRMLVARVIPIDDCQPTFNVPYVLPASTQDVAVCQGIIQSHQNQICSRVERLPNVATEVANSDETASSVRLVQHESETPMRHFDTKDPETRMVELLRIAVEKPEAYLAAVVESKQIVDANSTNPKLAAIHSRILRHGHWVSRNEFDSSAGIFLQPTIGWTPESSKMRVRRAMMAGETSADTILTGSKRLIFSVRNVEPTDFTFELWRPQIGALKLTAIDFAMKIGDAPVETMRLDSSKHRSRAIRLGKGDHQVEMWIPKAYANHYALVRIHEHAGSQRVINDATQPLLADELNTSEMRVGSMMRKYWVASQTTPLRFDVIGPAWIRIDELIDDNTTTRFEWVPAGKKRFELMPTGQVSHSRFRIFEYQHDPYHEQNVAYRSPSVSVPIPSPALDVAGAIEGLIPDSCGLRQHGVGWGDQLSLWSLGGWKQLGLFQPDDVFQLGQEDGTWKFQGGVTSRRALDEGDDRGLASDDFLETSLSHLQHDYWNDRYYETKILARLRKEGDPSIGFVHQGRWQSPGFWTPWPNLSLRRTRDPNFRVNAFNFRWKAFGYLQSPGTADPGFQNQTEWSFGGSATASRRYDITSRIHRVGTITALGRALSLNQPQYAPGTVDQDVFTQFKADHRHGAQWTQRIVFDQKLDRQWWIGFSGRTNEDWNVFQPDNVAVSLGQWGQTGPLQWGWSYRAREFQRDDDRFNDFLQETLNFDLRWERWRDSGRRFEVAATYRHDLTQQRHAFFVNFATYLSRGRGYWDHQPGSLRFGGIRKQRAIPKWLEWSDPSESFSQN